MCPFLGGIVKAALSDSGTFALRPVCLNVLHFWHLDSRGVDFLTLIYYVSLGSVEISIFWKQATIVACFSFRSKILELLILPRLTTVLPVRVTQQLA